MSKQQKVGNQLAFSVFKISSEDANYPATGLVASGKYAKGWQSQRFCNYPQIVLVQFPSTVRVKQVQILCHEYKIPSEIEIISITKGGEKSTRLGSFKLQNNASTQYKARELKSVYLGVDCQYIKLVLYKPHMNTKNLFSQVALMSLLFFGEFMEYETDYVSTLKTLDPIRGVSAQFKSTDRNLYTPIGTNSSERMMFSQSNFMSRQSVLLKDLFDDKMKALDSEKKKAMLSNDIEKAKTLKKAIDKTMKLAKLSQELEYKKMLAIDNEDYDAAKIIKAELDKVKRNLMSATDLPQISSSALSRRDITTPLMPKPMTADDITDPGRMMIHSISQIQTDLNRINYSVDKPDPNKSWNQKFEVTRTYDRPAMNYTNVYDNTLDPNEFENHSIPPQTVMDNDEFRRIDSMGQTAQHDEAVVPMHNKAPIDFSKVKDTQDDTDQIGGELEEEEFSAPEKARIDIMKQYFKEDTPKLVLSKKWQNRQKGIESFIKEFPGSLKEHGIAVQEHAVAIFLSTCKEKLPQLLDLGLDLFCIILEESKKSSFDIKFESSKTETMVAEVLDKMTESNPKISKKAEEIVKKKIMTEGYFDYNMIANFILSERSYLNHRYMTSEKHIFPRLGLMYFMIETSDQHTSKKPFPMKELIEYVIGKLSHANKKIRKRTQKIMVKMYENFGWYALEAHIARDVPQNQLQYLVKEIPEVESLLKKKDTNKGSESLREALKAVKEASQSIQKVEEPKPQKDSKSKVNKNKKPKK